MEKHLDIMENSNINPKMSKSYFWPVPFGFPMYDPYNTGPVSEAVLSPAGGIVAPRRNPYYTKPMNPATSPYRPVNTWNPYTNPYAPRRCSMNNPYTNPYAVGRRPMWNPSNPYSTKPVNPYWSPYTTQYRTAMGPLAPYMMPTSPIGRLRPMSVSGPVGTMPMEKPAGPPPMGPPPMGPPPMGPPPMGPRPF